MAQSAMAADVRMVVEPELVSLLDRAVLKIEFIDTKGDAIDLPEVEGLRIQYQGQSTETRFVNFKSTSKVVHTYVVTPAKTGDFTIGPVVAKYAGGQKVLEAKLRVVKKADDHEAQKISEIMFSRVSADRAAPYVQEPFGIELKVYLRDGVQIDGNFSLRGGLPESGLDGALQWRIAGRGREERNGTIFNVYTLRTTAKTLTAGTFAFRPEVQVNVVIPRQQRRSWGFDDPFFGDLFGRQETRPFVLECNRLDVPVQPIPLTGRPEGFTGGVGVFDFNVDVGPAAVKAGEPLTVKMRISGQGNLAQIVPPSLPESTGLKLYEVRAAPSGNPDVVRFEQVAIPISESLTNLPAIAFSYFNTQTADFRTIARGPFPVAVAPAPRQAAQVIATVPSTIRPETRVLGRDIVYLKPPPRAWRTARDAAWHDTAPFRILLPLPALLAFLVAAGSAWRSAWAKDAARIRRRRAPKEARRDLRRAGRALRKRDEAAFHEAAWDALAGYFGHRLNLAPGEVSLSAVLRRAPSGHEAIEHLFHAIEQRRFGLRTGDGSSPPEMKKLLRQLKATLRTCERMRL